MTSKILPWQGADFATLFEAVAGAVPPDRLALIHGERQIDWGTFQAEVDRVANGLIALSLNPGDVVGQLMRNSPDYMILFFACAQVRLTPVNLNYHYKSGELRDILTRFDVRAVVHDAEFATVAAEAAGAEITLIETETAFAALSGPNSAIEDGERLFFVATGGTTGMPKAVMWRQQDSAQALMLTNWPPPAGMPSGTPPLFSESLLDHAAKAAAMPPARALILSPMMHGVGLYSALIALLKGGAAVTMPGAKFDPDTVIDTVRDTQALSIVLVGDAFAHPLVTALQARADAGEALASLKMLSSSGAVFSESNKTALIAINPAMMVVDALGSSESAGTAVKITTAAGTMGGDAFTPVPGRDVRLFNADGSALPAGPGEGIVGRSGPLPLGYYKEPDLSARTFPTVDGVRYLVTGDRARIDEAGTITFLGRDNLCINTGGEKVFPEEVETTLCAHPAVQDARVFGVADPRFGQRIVAVVQGDSAAQAEIEAYIRGALATYKAPRTWCFTDRSLRLNNGKPDYKAARDVAGV
jgi:3-oxocholest-4-en-26-oate---CoA ligase